MNIRFRFSRQLFVAGVAVLIALNLYTFVAAYPETYTLTSGISAGGSILAKDFSAYYIGAWRLWNDPTHLYTFGSLNNGEPPIYPHPEAYKYLPSFLVVISPLLALEYQQALLAFDIIQFMLLPAIAFLLYHLLEKKGHAAAFVVMVIVLLQPLPTPSWGASASYYWQWGEGQSKVFVTFLLLLAFYFGSRGKPYLSGILFALGSFDPRFGLLALPLFMLYNRKNLKVAFISAAAMLLISNASLLYTGMGLGFLGMVVTTGISTPLYYYAYIPLLMLLSLMAVNHKEYTTALKRQFSAPTTNTGNPKEQK